MKRQLTRIDGNKWYHIETLKKYYGVSRQIVPEKIEYPDGKIFERVSFNHLWFNTRFLVHPKTKRLKYETDELYQELSNL